MSDFIGEKSRYRNLMVSVLATMIKDYLYAKEIDENVEAAFDRENGRKRKNKRSGAEQRYFSMLTLGLRAQNYIFADTWESDNYVFGFKFICRYIGLDPDRFRTAIRALRMATIRATMDSAKYN